MKPTFYILFAALAALCVSLVSCSEEEGSRPSAYVNVAVTVGQDAHGDVVFTTDKDIVLRPTNYRMFNGLDKLKRAFVSFYFVEETSLDDVRPGQEYAVVLDGAVYGIPTYTQCIDVAGSDYLSGGGDSLALLGKAVKTVTAGDNKPFIANGYLNIFPAFVYRADKPVTMALYFDGRKDVDAQGATVSLYFNNNVDIPTDDFNGAMVSFATEPLFNALALKGLNDEDTVTIRLSAKLTESGAATVVRVPLQELLR